MGLPAPGFNQHDWNRIAKGLIDPRISGYPFPTFAAAPTGVTAGFTYYDSALAKVRTWDGAIWNNHF